MALTSKTKKRQKTLDAENPGEITSDFTLMEYALLPWGGQGRRKGKKKEKFNHEKTRKITEVKSKRQKD